MRRRRGLNGRSIRLTLVLTAVRRTCFAIDLVTSALSSAAFGGLRFISSHAHAGSIGRRAAGRDRDRPPGGSRFLLGMYRKDAVLAWNSGHACGRRDIAGAAPAGNAAVGGRFLRMPWQPACGLTDTPRLC
jgi:hypothetical protein